MSAQFGWAGVREMREAWDAMHGLFPKFALRGAKAEKKRTVAWDAWKEIGFDINKSILFQQEIGDCVSFGGAIGVVAVAAHEIKRLGEFERFHVAFPPYLYWHSRQTPEGGNGRIRGDGSLGIWLANSIQKYGVLRADYEGCPKYSGSVAKSWGSSRQLDSKLMAEGSQHLIRSAARLNSAEEVRDAVCNGHYCTIASNRGFSMRLLDDRGKSWFQGSDTWPHQMSVIGFDVEPEDCFYIRNQWGTAHGNQLDGPPGGAWIRIADFDRWVSNPETECFALSMFDGFPTEEEKPESWFF